MPRACSARSTRWLCHSNSGRSRASRRCSPAPICRRPPSASWISSTVPADAAIQLRDVAFEYLTNGRVTRAVEDVSLEVTRGATVAFVGPSGCGKSTLLKLVAGLLTTSRGTIIVDGRPVKGPLENVGMAFQNPVLLPWRTVLDNLLLPFEILRENGDPRAPDRAVWKDKASALLKTVGLAGAEHRQPRELSGGMRQRVSLCRALIHEPRLLLQQIVLPTPSGIALTMVHTAGPIAFHARHTLVTTLLGFGFAVGLGLLLGFAIGASATVHDAIYPLLVGFNSIPKAAMVPLLVMWFGIGAVPAVLTAFLLAFFPVAVNVAVGLGTLGAELGGGR